MKIPIRTANRAYDPREEMEYREQARWPGRDPRWTGREDDGRAPGRGHGLVDGADYHRDGHGEAVDELERTVDLGGDHRADEPGPDAEERAEPNEWKDRYARLLADFENHKKHAERERARLAGLGKESVLDDVFPLVEYMEMAIKATKDAGEQSGVLEGIELVYKQLLALLEKHGVERVPALGENFDPTLHEAVAVVPAHDAPEGTVVEELRPGFVRNEKLLRPASVIVAK